MNDWLGNQTSRFIFHFQNYGKLNGAHDHWSGPMRNSGALANALIGIKLSTYNKIAAFGANFVQCAFDKIF